MRIIVFSIWVVFSASYALASDFSLERNSLGLHDYGEYAARHSHSRGEADKGTGRMEGFLSAPSGSVPGDLTAKPRTFKTLVTVNGRPAVELNSALFAELQKINRQVNSDIRFVDDLSLYEKADFWAIVDGVGWGDCEDYTMTKFSRLRWEYGWPRSVLRPALLWVRLAGKVYYHAVLTVDTTRGTLVLDSLQQRILPFDDRAFDQYLWHRRLSSDNSWVRINSKKSPALRRALTEPRRSNHRQPVVRYSSFSD